MNEITLDLDDLEVESFAATSQSPNREGTIYGNEDLTYDCGGGGENSDACDTYEWELTCGASCDPPEDELCDA